MSVSRLRRMRREHGAIAVVVVLLFSSMVLIGSAALTVDLGRINSERRQLQNGADAVALSVAMDCNNLGNCLSGDVAKRQDLADKNAMDGTTTIGRTDGLTAICGTGPGLTACPPLSPKLTDCVAPSSMPAEWVRVYTKTRESNGGTILPYAFAQALSGQASGVGVQACAQAGLVSSYDAKNVLPLTQSLCAWKAATDNGTDFPPMPPYSTSPQLPASQNPTVTVPSEIDLDQIAKIVVMNDPNAGAATCGKDPATPGLYTPGNFGWLDESSACQAVSVGDTIGGTGGVSSSSDCATILPQKVGQIVYIPITDGSSGTGQNTVYNVSGMAAFYLAGVDFEGDAASKLFNGFDPKVYDPAVSKKVLLGCDKSTQGCLWGWYLQPLIPGGAVWSGGGSYGPKTVSLLG